MLKFSNFISSKSKIYIVKDNSEYLGIFHFVEMNAKFRTLVAMKIKF